MMHSIPPEPLCHSRPTNIGPNRPDTIPAARHHDRTSASEPLLQTTYSTQFSARKRILGRASAQRSPPAVASRVTDRRSDRNEQHRAAPGHHPAHLASPPHTLRRGLSVPVDRKPPPSPIKDRRSAYWPSPCPFSGSRVVNSGHSPHLSPCSRSPGRPRASEESPCEVPEVSLHLLNWVVGVV
jgi:hypothetical protein